MHDSIILCVISLSHKLANGESISLCDFFRFNLIQIVISLVVLNSF